MNKEALSKSKTQGLSKSKVMTGLQCEKALYFASHSPDIAGETSDAQQLIFDQGHLVGIEAQKRFPGGVLIEAPHTDSKLALKQTQTAIAEKALHIYEATFEYKDVLVKVDILSRANSKASWEIIEVKSSTQPKEVHIQDVAIQLWVVRGAGLKVKSASILHINNQCTYPDLESLFTRADVTTQAEALLEALPKTVSNFQKMLAQVSAPKIDIGPHCDDPYECSFKDHCWSAKKIPSPSTFDIPKLASKTKWELYEKGTLNLSDLDVSEFKPAQRRMIECSVEGKTFVDEKAIHKEIGKWEYPLSFLDFETINYAIPRYIGVRAYQQLPFQFSCHIQNEPSAKLTHHEYLHTEDTDPRESMARVLAESVSKNGSVVAYHMGFERQVLETLAEMFPKYRETLTSIAERLVDPLPIFRAHVYDPKFYGSFSIKNVAPAILGDSASYEGMAVGGGTEAQSAYLQMISPETAEAERKKLRVALLEYCKKDTLGMVELVWWLQSQVRRI